MPNPLSRALTAWRSRPILPGPLATDAGIGPGDTRAAIGLALTPWQAGKPQWPRRDLSTFSRDGYERLALIFRCVQVVASAAGSAPLRVYDEGNDDEEVEDHPLRLLMRRPNPEMWESRFWSFVAMTVSVAGFCLVEKERTAGGRTVALWPLRPDWCRPILRDQAPPDWEYRVPGRREPFVLNADDVLVYTYADLPDRWPCGIGPVEILLREIGMQNAMTDFLKAFFDGGALPQQMVIADLMPGQRLTQAEKDAMAESFMQRYGGLGRSWAPLFAGGIKDVKRIGFDFDELAWTDLRDLSDLAICQAFGIHPSMVATRAGLEHSDSRANAAEARRGFYEDTISPLWDRFDGTTTLGLLPELDQRPGIELRFDASDIPALQENRNDRASWLTQAFLGGGIPASVYATELGIPAPAQDFYLRSMAQDAIPADDPLGEQRPARAPLPLFGGQGGDDEDDENEEERAALRAIRSGRGPAERRAAIGATNRELIQRLADRTAPMLRAFFRAQGERVIAAVAAPAGIAVLASRNGHETRDIADIDWTEEERRLSETLARLHALAGETAYAAVNDSLGIGLSFDLANPNIRAMIDQLATRVVGITAETRADVARVVTDGLTEGISVDDLSKRLRGLFAETYKGRSLTIARTESQVSFNGASALGYAESGLVDRAQLLDNPAHDTDPGSDGLTCAERNGLIVPLSDVGRHIEAEHPNGTLSIAPVLIGED